MQMRPLLPRACADSGPRLSHAHDRPDLVPVQVGVSVPATSANLGPGYDSLGLALGIRNEVTAQVADTLSITVIGEGAGEVAVDGDNLVHASMVRGFEAMGVPTPAVAMTCLNNIPHGRGLGSSSSAIVAGLGIARALVVDGEQRLPLDAVFRLAAEIEGHPDNVAPATYGGFTVAYEQDGTSRALRVPVDPQVRVVVFIPDSPVPTKLARGLLPATVPHADAAANSGRTALLVAALAGSPEHLLDATEDWLHQRYRQPAMPESCALVHELRDAGHAAVISGAGPTVLAFTDASSQADVVRRAPAAWRVLQPDLDGSGLTALV